jgi:poly(3-hydroxybutyrate) depolymerase
MLPHPDVKAPGSMHLEELGQASLPANPTERGVDLKYKLTVGGLSRQVNVHLPPRFDPTTPTEAYYLLDGVVINNPAGNMLGINGWAKTADQHGFVAAGLEQSTASTVRPFGITIPSSIFGKAIPSATSWSIPKNLGSGLLNPTRGINDVDFFAATHGALANSMNVESNNIVTFSDGSSLANAVAAYMPVGSIDGVANVAGTIMRGNPAPKAGIKGFFVNSELDPTMKIEGGPGLGATKHLAKIGLRNIFNSRPLDQAPRYAEASGLNPTPTVTDTDSFIQQSYALSPAEEATVTAFRLKIGGHTWPGRATGDGTNTALTDINGQTLTQTQFDTNNLIVEFLRRGRTIQRTLDSRG